MSTPVRPHSNNFDALRLMAAFGVLLSHMFPLSGRPEPSAFHLAGSGTALVVFFAISGYLVSQSWLKDPHPLRFFGRRLLRLWPALFVMTLLVSFFLAPAVTRHSLFDLFQMKEYLGWFRNLTLIELFHKDVFAFRSNPAAEMNGSIWSIPLEFFCYILVFAFGFTRTFKWAAPLMLVVLIALYWHAGHEPWMLAQRPVPWLMLGKLGATFMLGALFALFPKLFLSPWVYGALGALGVGLIAGGESVLGLGLATPAIIIPLGRASWPGLRSVGKYGDFSYGVYLYAWPVQQTLVWAWGKETSIWVLEAAAMGVTFAFAVLSWYLVEKPALHFKPSRRADTSRI